MTATSESATTPSASASAIEFTRALVQRFNVAWNEHDLPAALALISDDCVFDATSPAPDGTRVVGPAAIRAVWEPIFADAHSRFSVEDAITAADHVVQRWRYDWDGGHIRGIDLITVAAGRITAKLAYVKG
ncbi:MAG: hypothetical protein JWN95_2681 [Frankiales bacterium]|nr:hypothetical protein [Frankiales bacterium]